MARMLVLRSMLCALLAQLAVLSLANAAAVHPRSVCTPTQCRCKAGASSVWGTDASGCPACYCVASAETTAPTPAPARATTAAATTARATTAAPTTAGRSQCPTYAPCRCKAGAMSVTLADPQGCTFCACVATDVPAATNAPATTVRPDTRPQCPTARSCNCKPGATSVDVTDEQGCPSCACVASDQPASAAPTSLPARATTINARSMCPTVRACNCKPGAFSIDITDDQGCPSCACVASDEPTTAAGRATTRASSRPEQCPTVRSCKCKPGATSIDITDDQGCPSCACVATGTETELTTARSETRPATTGRPNQCPTFRACRCKPGAVSIDISDDQGCPSCACIAVSTDSDSGSGEEQQPTTAAPATRATTAAATRASTRVATTAETCGEVYMCRCKPEAYESWESDARGCPVCACLPRTDLPASTAARATTARPATTTEVRATTVAATNAQCPIVTCRCKPGAQIAWSRSSTGCSSCYCEAVATEAPATTVQPTTLQRTTLAPTRAATTIAPVCPTVQQCRCKPEAILTWTTDASGCATCSCEANPALATTAAPTTARATTAAPTTARATTRAATTTARATTAAPTTARATTTVACDAALATCRCKAGAISLFTRDSRGCPTCSCVGV